MASHGLFNINHTFLSFFTSLFACFLPCIADEKPAAEKPNLLFIYLDDYGWKDAGFMGSDFYETPNIDQLASEGMVFSDAYSAAANCAPARACLLSGQYTPRHQIFNVGTAARGEAVNRRLKHIPGVDTLNPAIETWAARAQKNGYATASIGKWHLSQDPKDYGFDVNIGGTRKGSPSAGYYPPHPNVPGLEDAPENEYLTDRINAEAIEFISENQGQPWLLYLTHFAVHTPLNAKKELIAKYDAKKRGDIHQNATMATMIQAVDDGIGKIVDTLERLNLNENTIIIFSSDNGGYGPATDMHPLYGYKGTYYEGGIRVPFFVKWPNVVKPRLKTKAITSGVDIYPTICEMLEIEGPQNQTLDGISLVPILKGTRPDPNRAIFWHFPAYLQSYKQVTDEQRDSLFRSRPCSIIREGKWKLHYYYETKEMELYDLHRDIGETKNLSRIKPVKTANLFGKLENWLAHTNAPIPNSPNPDFNQEAYAKNLNQAKTAR